MSFSLPVYPALPGRKIDFALTPEFRTLKFTSESGKRQHFGVMSLPIWHLSLNYDFLREESAFGELESILGFFLLRNAALEPFLIKVPHDNFRASQFLGTGDGVTAKFQMTRDYGGFREPVYGVDAGFTVTVNGVLTVAFTELDGEITFYAAPASGAALLVQSIGYYYRVTFKSDQLDFNRFLFNLWELKKVELETYK